MKKTIRPDGRHHSMPKGIYEFFSDLEAISGVESIDSGRFIPRNRALEFEARIQFYDSSKRTFRLRVESEGFISYPQVRVSSDAKEKVENYIKNYNSGEKIAIGVLFETSYENSVGVGV
ncbi:Uncharacterised protein [uncultured archaeon]|nr:Uncharacterised protein [uncultured archaeon]